MKKVVEELENLAKRVEVFADNIPLVEDEIENMCGKKGRLYLASDKIRDAKEYLRVLINNE